MYLLLPLSFAILIALPLSAEPVRLSDAEGTLQIEGTLISRDGELYRIDTAFGPVTVDAGALTCSGAGCPDPTDLIVRATVGGNEELVHRLFPALLEVFADARSWNSVRLFHADEHVIWELRERETSRLVAIFEVKALSLEDTRKGLRDGELTLGLSFDESESDMRHDVVALDALVPAVAPDNPRAMVTLSQLSYLLSGEGASWARLGGPSVPVSVHVPSSLEVDPSVFGLDTLPSNLETHPSVSQLADTVARNSAAIGLVPYSSLGNAVPLIVSGSCGLATPATRDTLRAEDYPLTQPVFLNSVGADHPKVVRDLIAFSRSAAVQPIIRATGFVDQAIGRIGFEQQGDRIASAVLSAGDDPERVAEVRDMIGVLLGGERLTLTFRFRDGESTLDPQSTSNVQRLADAISDGLFDGQDIIFVGFSDGIGDPDANLRLSERRARSVRRAVSARLPETEVALDVAAFGELMPMACDDAPWGGRVNRRVEVWIKPQEVDP
ncbi:MAG: OmpA family protein [Pseudomonadota bacterium]